MGQLTFSNKDEFLSVMEKIEGAMVSYAHFGGLGSDPPDYAELFYTLFASKEIVVYEIPYTYDFNMKENEYIMQKYMALLPKTRWRTDTQIEKVRLNAIKIFNQFGGLDCFDGIIISSEEKAMVYCGDMQMHEFFNILRNDELRSYTSLSILPYPYIKDDKTNESLFYTFAFSPAAVDKIRRFIDDEWEKIPQSISDI